ncbi:MAG TPA: potassium-transporting ATPase subunit C, partial [Ktedonobacterales bacterium]
MTHTTPTSLGGDATEQATPPVASGRRAVLRQLWPAVALTLVLTVLLGLAYPAAITGLAQALFPSQANGSLLYVNGKPVASTLIGQYWTQPQYFHVRP